ncbi:hypothetical protein [Pseudescherichia sp.]|uniref:hypothetical protein n=1 Tax=Pseudescherichia sp. TaxID=2055881 RepID=UPI00289E1B14|nr:hypothetical protein [Pseudescherichia sp.]
MSEIAEYLQPCLVAFETKWQPGCRIVLREPTLSISDEALLRRFSWTVDTRGIRSGLAGKTFYAERYGGYGLGVHGGGARCGYDGDRYQLKGIGPNPLLGIIGEDDIGQSDGELTLASALYETIWSRILDVVLPYGANRCQAVLAVTENGTCRRALLLRDGYLRPAHFERAAYFRSGGDNARYEQAEDVKRTSAMCKRLPEILAATFNLQTDSQSYLQAGLCEFARRQAAQIAFANSRFLYHSVSSSNFSLDGKWHDFTAVSLFEPYDIPVDKDMDSAWAGMWQQYALVAEVLTSWIYHHAKYAHLSDAMRQALQTSVLTAFERELYRCYAWHLLCLMGIPRAIAEIIYTEEPVQAWTTSLLSLLPSFPFWLRQARGDLHLLDLSFSRVTQHSRNEAFFSQISVERFLQQRDAVRLRVFAVAKERGITAANVALAIEINVAKFLFRSRELSYAAMTTFLDATLDDPGATLDEKIATLQPWCDSVVKLGQFHLHADKGDNITCWQDDALTIVFDMRRGTFNVSVNGRSRQLTPAALRDAVSTCAEGKAFLDYCAQNPLGSLLEAWMRDGH